MYTKFVSSRAAGLTALALAVAACGCSSPTAEEAQVTGKVTVQSAPANPGATVTFVAPGNKEVSTTVGPDGAYTIMNPPLGSVQIVVKGSAIPKVSAGPEAPAGMKAPAGATIPKKYASPNNGLTYTVVAGKQTKDIDLTP